MKYIMFSLVAVMALAIAMPAYAETYEIQILPESHTDDCLPDCIQPTILKINPGDTVIWSNTELCEDDFDERCSRIFSMVSGDPQTGVDGTFDTGAIFPTKSSREISFDYEGEFLYFDPGHKWIQGLIVVGTPTTEQEVEVEVTTEVEVEQDDGTIETEVITETKVEVQEVEVEPVFEQKPQVRTAVDELLGLLYPEDINNIRVMHNVGSNVDHDTAYNIYYIHDNELAHSAVNTENSQLQFGFLNPESGTIILKLPNDLIGETLAVVSQNDELLVHTYESHGEFSIVEIQLNETQKFTLTATYVTPEYLNIIVLASVISAVVGIGIYSAKRQPTLVLKA